MKSLSKTLCAILPLRYIMREIGFEQKGPTPLLQDNQGAIAAQLNPLTRNLKHVNMRIHHIRQVVRDGEMEPMYVRTDDTVADIFTKSLPKKRFLRLRALVLGGRDPETGERHPGMPTKVKKQLGY